jgi:hypothetical protein
MYLLNFTPLFWHGAYSILQTRQITSFFSLLLNFKVNNTIINIHISYLFSSYYGAKLDAA